MIKTFILNPFQVNTYIVSDKNKTLSLLILHVMAKKKKIDFRLY